VVPRQLFVTEHVRGEVQLPVLRERLRSRGSFHAIARGYAGPSLLAMILGRQITRVINR